MAARCQNRSEPVIVPIVEKGSADDEDEFLRTVLEWLAGEMEQLPDLEVLSGQQATIQ